MSALPSPAIKTGDFEARWTDSDAGERRAAVVTITGDTLAEIHHATSFVADLADLPSRVDTFVTRALILIAAGKKQAAIDELTALRAEARTLAERAELEAT